MKRVLILCTLFFTLPLQAGNNKVGLVLSGGGAKGIAHIGVIKALEDNEIPIDYVAGTSAGAIVGSLYSCGWTPEEILQLFTSPGFKYWSSGTVSEKEIYYQSKPEPLPDWVDFGVNIGKDKGKENVFDQIIPSHLISPIPMNLEFLKLFAPYTAQCEEDFDKLFVPLRTVCSDVYHKHKIVCKSGSVGDAVRASMSFPLVFKPIEMDGVLVYDGGIYDNFPVDVMHEDFDPGFIIGVSVSGPDGKPEPGNIYSQLEDMIIQNNNYNLPEEWGVKIQVPVLNFGVFDWDEAQTIYEIGYKTGLEMVDSIRQRCPERRSLAEVNARREAFKARTPDLKFESVEVTGVTPSQADYIRKLFTENGEEDITMKEVSAGYYRAVTDGKFIDLLPQARFADDGKANLLLKATLKQPWTIGAGGWITSSVQSQLFVTFGYHTLSLNSFDADLSGWIGQSYYAAMLSGKISLPTTNPSSLRLMGVVSRQKYYDNELMFYQNNTPSFVNEAQQFVRLEYSLAMGKPAKGYGRISYGHIMDQYFPETGNHAAVREQTDYKTLAVEAGYEANTLGDQLYPMSGRKLNASLVATYTNAHTGELKYGGHIGASLKAHWMHFYPVGKQFIVGGMAEGLGTVAKLYQNYTATLVQAPAFAPTPSTRNYFNTAFRSDNYLACGVIPVWNPLQKFQLRGDFYLYSPVRNLRPTPKGGCEYYGWFRKAEFIGEVAAVYNFKFASLSLYCNYLTYPARNWNFGLNLGLLFQAPRLIR